MGHADCATSFRLGEFNAYFAVCRVPITLPFLLYFVQLFGGIVVKSYVCFRSNRVSVGIRVQIQQQRPAAPKALRSA